MAQNGAPLDKPQQSISSTFSSARQPLPRTLSSRASSTTSVATRDFNIPPESDAALKLPRSVSVMRQHTISGAAQLPGGPPPHGRPAAAPPAPPLPPTIPSYPEGAQQEQQQEEEEEEGGSFRTVHIRTSETKEPKGPVAAFFDELPFIGTPPDFVSNGIRTSKYSLLTFLPVNLYEQFSRAANMYFAVIVALQAIPGLSPVPWYTSLMPLLVVLAVNMVKEAYDDYFRHKSDAHINSQVVTVLRETGDVRLAWREVQVGDLLKINDNEPIPADMVLLSSSDPDKLCYVETANLDGETNLKVKYSYAGTADMATARDYTRKTFTINCEQPNPKLYSFEGAIRSSGAAGAEVADPLDASQLLLRGCMLRKTEWVVGVVVFTGNDTKVMRNQLPSPRKVTQLERNTNMLVMGMMAYLLIMGMLLATGHEVWETTVGNKSWYIPRAGTWDHAPGLADFFITVVRFLLLMAQTIPISLYVTLEMVKVLQCKLLYERDREMYHSETDTPLEARTTTLNEELGQVEYVLSDKTGTLTQNIMGFVWASFGGKLYGSAGPVPGKLHTMRSGAEDELTGDEAPADTPHSIARDAGVKAALAAGQAEACGFFTALALCNTVVPTANDEGQLLYQAASPDEEALVQGTAYLGVKLLSRTADSVELARRATPAQRAAAAAAGRPDEVEVLERWSVLAVVEFSSDRKRMSTVCRSPQGKIYLHCKGADTMVLERIAKGQRLEQPVRRHLDQMAAGGYRTLVVAERELTEEQFQSWYLEWNAACAALDNRDEKMAAVAELLERDMTLVGATAVEDKLQDGVPDALSQLLAMGIKVWVLTGDKVETAISIAKTCRLLVPGMEVLEIRENTLLRDDSTPLQVLKELAIPLSGYTSKIGAGRAAAGLVIDGQALALCLADDEAALAFLHLCKMCKSVVCCRVSPMQKAQVTQLVKEKAGAITLGIGDGANDVSMIQAAHIGCGISGREGRAAVMASDFSFAQFRFLTRLLLIHGRWSYKRCCEVVCYAFYKNLVYVLALVLFSCFCGFSAQSLFPALFLASYNAFWTALPTIAFALLDRDLPEEVIESYPILYQETAGQTRPKFFKQAASWIGLGVWHGLVAFFVPYLSLVWGLSRQGQHASISMAGTSVFTSVLVIVTLKVLMRGNFLTWVNHVAMWAPLIIWLPFLAIYQIMFKSFPADYKMLTELSDQPAFWYSVFLLAPAMALMVDFTLAQLQKYLWPENVQLLQEYNSLHPHKEKSLSMSSTAALLGSRPAAVAVLEEPSLLGRRSPIHGHFSISVSSSTLSRSNTKRQISSRGGGLAASADAAVAAVDRRRAGANPLSGEV